MGAADIFQHIAAGIGGGMGGYVQTSMQQQALDQKAEMARLAQDIKLLTTMISAESREKIGAARNATTENVANTAAGSRENVANIQGGTARDVAGIQGENSANVANIQGGTARDVEGMRGVTARDVEGIRGENTANVANIQGRSAANVANIQGSTGRAVAGINAQGGIDRQHMINDQDTFEFQQSFPLDVFEAETGRINARRPRTSTNIFAVPNVVTGAGAPGAAAPAAAPQQPAAQDTFKPTYPMAPAAPAAAPPVAAAPMQPPTAPFEINASMRSLTQRFAALVTAKSRARSPQERAAIQQQIDDIKQQAKALEGLQGP